MSDTSECISCGKRVTDDGTWKPGQVCLFGTLFACSMACAEKYAAAFAAEGYRPGEPHFEAVLPAGEVEAK